MIDFARTPMGQRFFERPLPDLMKNLARLADGVERVVKLLEEEERIAARTKGAHE